MKQEEIKTLKKMVRENIKHSLKGVGVTKENIKGIDYAINGGSVTIKIRIDIPVVATPYMSCIGYSGQEEVSDGIYELTYTIEK